MAGLVLFVILVMKQNSSGYVSMEEIAHMAAGLPGTDGMKLKDAQGTNTVFGMVPDEYIYYKTDDIMDVRELFIAREPEADAMDQIQEAAALRLKTQMDNFNGYGTDQLDKLEHAIITQRGDYYFYAVGDDADEWQQSFLQMVR